MTIKELERRTGLPRTSIRFYEQEGLLTPERRENNYRDYTEDNVRTLEKIKLLRQLSLDLETIRRLQAGELSLSLALAGQALALEGDRADLERYAQVCEELSRAGTTYETLDPVPWLAALEEKSLPLSRRVDPAEQDSIAAAPYPWRRFFARSLDLACTEILWCALQYLVLHWYWPEFGLMGFADGIVTAWGAWLFLLVLEPILLCTWGYTPGKWLLRLKVRREDGSKVDWERAVIRTARIFLRGFALGVPLLNILCLGTCYDRCKKDQVMPWDRGLRYTVRPAGKKRVAVYVALVLLYPLPILAIEGESYRLPNPAGPLNQEQVVENYNFLERRTHGSTHFLGSHPASSLRPDGTWAQPPAAALDQDHWVEFPDGEAGEWSPLAFETDPRGEVTGLTVTWTPSENPYRPELDLRQSIEGYLPNLMLALSPGAEEWNAPWEIAWQARRSDTESIVLDLPDADFTRPGTYTLPEGLPGMELTMEILVSEGYQTKLHPGTNVAWNGVLVPDGTGPSELVLQFTVSCSG